MNMQNINAESVKKFIMDQVFTPGQGGAQFYQAPKNKSKKLLDEILIVNPKTNIPEGSCSRMEIRGENRWHRETFIFVENYLNEFVIYKNL